MKNKKHSYNKHKSVKTVKKNALIWVVGIMLVLGTFIYAAYSKYIELPLIAGVMDDYQYNLGQSAAGNISDKVKKYNTSKSTDQIRAEAQLTLREMAKAEPTNKPLQQIAANADIAVKAKPIKKEAQDAAEEVVKTQNTTITNDVAAIAKTAADRKAAADKLAAEQAAAELAAKIAADQAAVMVETQTSLIAKKDSCPGGNGVKIPPGSFVATGYGLDDNGHKCTTGGCSKRECVEIKDDCSHGVVRACNVQYSINPSSVILPFSAGSEYTIGMTEAEVKEKQKADPTFKKPEIVKNCYEGNGTIQTTGTLKGNTRCVDGAWLPDKSSTCNGSTPIFNPLTNSCDPVPGPTQAELDDAARKEREAAAKLKAEQEKDASRLKTPYSKAGCTAALKPGEKCVLSSDNALLYMIASNDLAANVAIKSGVPTKLQTSEINKPAASTLLDDTYKGESDCEKELKARGVTGKCEGIAGGTYYKIVPFISYDFGGSSNTNNTQNNETSEENQTSNLSNGDSTPVKSNPAAGTIFSNPKDSNELTARRDCEAAKTAGYECKSVGFNKYQLVLIPTVTSPLNSNAKPLSLQNSAGKTSGQVNDPNDCKYTPVATDPVSDKWVCPTEQTVAQFTPKSNERPEGQKSYVAPGNKLYNGGSCYEDNGACLSGYCESKVGFDKCANLPPSIQENIDKLSSNMMENGGCVETFIESGVRVKCESSSSEPVFEFCDKGNGRYDSNGKCIPASGTAIQPTATKTGATVGCVGGATVGAIYGATLGFGVLSGPLAVLGAVVGCGAGVVSGGAVGAGIDLATTPSAQTSQVNETDLKNVVKDAGPLTLEKGTLTDDPSKCENNGYDSSQNWGGSIKIGYHVYTCN